MIFRPCLVNNSSRRLYPEGRAGNFAGPVLRKAAWAAGPPPSFAPWPSEVSRLRRPDLFTKHGLNLWKSSLTGPNAGARSRPSPIAGWSSPVARQAHNLKVVGSNPTPAPNFSPLDHSKGLFCAYLHSLGELLGCYRSIAAFIGFLWGVLKKSSKS